MVFLKYCFPNIKDSDFYAFRILCVPVFMRSEFEIPGMMLPEMMFPDLMRIPFGLYIFHWLKLA